MGLVSEAKGKRKAHVDLPEALPVRPGEIPDIAENRNIDATEALYKLDIPLIVIGIILEPDLCSPEVQPQRPIDPRLLFLKRIAEDIKLQPPRW